jgi:hypothetical protein
VLLVSYLEVKFVVKLVVGRSKLGGCAKRAGAKKIPSVTCSLPTWQLRCTDTDRPINLHHRLPFVSCQSAEID